MARKAIPGGVGVAVAISARLFPMRNANVIVWSFFRQGV